jgi:hypothetical protein
VKKGRREGRKEERGGREKERKEERERRCRKRVFRATRTSQGKLLS